MILLSSLYPVLTCVLAYAALGKLGRLAEFIGQLTAYRLLPARLSRAAAVAVLAAELGCAGLLVAPVTRTVGALLAAVLFAVFLVAQASAVVRGLLIDCGCFGGSDELSVVGPVSLARTALLLAMALAAALGVLPELVRLLSNQVAPR